MPPPPPLASRCATILAMLCAAVAARAARQASVRPLLVQLWGALRRLSGRLESLAARVQAGRLPAARPASRTPRPDRPRPPRPRLPAGFAWLVRQAPETAPYGAQLQALLDDPDLAALLQAAPQAGRLLRPLCRMLGVRPGPALALKRPPPPAARRRPGPQRPARPPDLRPRRSRAFRLGSFLLPPRRDADSLARAQAGPVRMREKRFDTDTS